jgi:hypothetical protein
MSAWAPAVLSVLAILQAGAAPVADTPNTVEGVVVTAKPSTPPEEAISNFVGAVTAKVGDKRLSRWDRKICPGVIGMRADYARQLIDGIATTAQRVGLEVGAPGCKANIVILVTDESDAIVANAIKKNGDAFSKYDTAMTRGRKALDGFVDSKAPVRWWHVTGRVGADGQKYTPGQSLKIRDASHVRANTRNDFDHVIIVVDVKRVGVIRFQALVDYVSMVGLAQVDPDADTAGIPTILNLFSDRDAGAAPAPGLTDWDVAYLQGVYSARRDVKRGSRQVADVVRSMAGALVAPKGDAKAPPNP